MNIEKAIQYSKNKLNKVSETANLDSEILLSYVLGKNRSFLISHNLDNLSFFQTLKFKILVRKRSRLFPIAQLIREKEFFMLNFFINKNVLIPRPDTELLVEEIIKLIKENKFKKFTLIDVGTGSACIPISVCKNDNKINAIALDISNKALKVAKKNIKKYNLKSRIKLVKSNLLDNLKTDDLDKNLIISANLPYLPIYMKNNSIKYEPKKALYSGDDGLDLYKKLIDQLNAIKVKYLFFECFNEQAKVISNRLRKNYKKYKIKKMNGRTVLLIMKKTS